MTVPSLPRANSVPRRLSLTLPVATNKPTFVHTVHTDDEEPIKNIQVATTTTNRQIPIRLPPTTSSASISSQNARASTALLQTAPLTNLLQRQVTDIGENLSTKPASNIIGPSKILSDFTMNNNSIRQAEAMAREAIQGIARLQHQQRYKALPNNNHRSPSAARRVIINLQNNQCVSLDSRLSSAMKPPVVPSGSRSTQKNNLYYIPVLHEIQMPSDMSHSSADVPSDATLSNSNNYKNEFHIEIPVTISKSNDQENRDDNDDGIFIRERRASISNGSNSNQTLKSILKRSSSRDTVARKNVSFMNA